MSRWHHRLLPLSLIILCCFVACHRDDSSPAAQVHGQPITRLELEQAMRSQLWTHNQKWADLDAAARKQTRWLVLENLVNDHLIRAFRLRDVTAATPPTPSEKRESDMMQRQFADPAEFPKRLAAQQQTPRSLATGIHEAQLDEAWIAQKIQPDLQAITSQHLRAWYDEFKETLRIPQAFHAAHLFLTRHDKTRPDREAEIREIRRQLMAKEKTFAQLTATHSDDARTKTLGGDLGWFTQQRMPADFIAAVEHLKPGQCSDPVPTQLGWHLILLMERRPSRLPTFEEAQGEIAAQLTSARREEAVQHLIAELRQRSQQPEQSVFYHAEVIDRAEPAP
jgi:parvulin-like peptidyl-prolyl isomerase